MGRLRSTLGAVLVTAMVSTAVFGQQREPTRSTAPGPEYTGSAAATARLWQEGDSGERLHLRGRVVDVNGSPVAGAEINLWQADGDGAYHEDRYRALLTTDPRGEFRLTTVVPGQYFGLKHIHLSITHPDHEFLTTRILFKGDPNLSSHDQDLAILLEQVQMDDEVVMLGSVEFVLERF